MTKMGEDPWAPAPSGSGELSKRLFARYFSRPGAIRFSTFERITLISNKFFDGDNRASTCKIFQHNTESIKDRSKAAPVNRISGGAMQDLAEIDVRGLKIVRPIPYPQVAAS